MLYSDIVKMLASKINQYPIPKGIVAIYIYGSAIKGKLREDSDIDLAILPSYDIECERRLEMISRVEGIFRSIFRESYKKLEISVVDIRGRYTSLMLQYKIVTEGTRIYESDSVQRKEFENFLKGEYYDFQNYINFLRRKKYGDILQKV